MDLYSLSHAGIVHAGPVLPFGKIYISPQGQTNWKIVHHIQPLLYMLVLNMCYVIGRCNGALKSFDN